MNENDLVHDLTLMLMYLTSWKEKHAGGQGLRTWKSYDWDVIDHLQDAGLIATSNRAKSAWLTPDGEQEAKMLVDVYGTLISSFQSQAAAALGKRLSRSNEPAFRFRIDLDLEGRECWRELVVPQDFSFEDLHDVIQASFLWQDYHLFDFHLTSKKQRIMVTSLDDGTNPEGIYDADEVVDAAQTPLTDVFPRTKTATYTYDYGDYWVHKLRLVETIDCYEGQMPICTDGAGDAPPEDVGGPGGYEDFLKILADPTDPDHAEVRSWGEDQGFEHFNTERVNQRIHAWYFTAVDDPRYDAPFADVPVEPASPGEKGNGTGSNPNLRLVP